MQKHPNLTPKRVLRRHREIEKRYPDDKKVHELVEQGSVSRKEFLGFITKAIKTK